MRILRQQICPATASALPRLMDRLSALEAFVAVAETGSFTRAAAQRRLSTPMMTLHVARLEEHLGARLFNRTTRRVDLTEEGLRLLPHAREVIAAYGAAEGALLPGRGLVGRVRIDAPASIGHRRIVPLLAELQAAYPAIAIDLSLGDRGTVFRIDGFDIILRVGEAPLSGWITKPLGETRQLCIAAPAYLARHGTPARPEDVHAHRCLLYASVEAPGGSPWLFARNGRPIRLRPPPAHTFNDGAAILAAARAGLGIAQHLETIARDDLLAGALVPVLLDHVAPAITVSLMSARERHGLPHVRAIMDYLIERVDWQLD
ncbi:MAG TPA: LysR family transcriptional regulator [Novosphingobium sp.]|nr:LysR family transcriptional regulator [Novosphingobium sp.]